MYSPAPIEMISACAAAMPAASTGNCWLVAVAAAAAPAHRDDGAVARDLVEARSELTERDVLRAVDVSGIPLVLLAHVEKVESGTLLADIRGQHTAILAHGGSGGHRRDARTTSERARRPGVHGQPYPRAARGAAARQRRRRRSR